MSSNHSNPSPVIQRREPSAVSVVQRRPLAATQAPASPPSIIERMQDKLIIDRNLLEDECQDHANRVREIGDALALAVSRKDAAKHKLKEAEATAENQIRAAATNGEKLTVKAIESKVLTHQDVRQHSQRLAECELEVGRLWALRDAFSARTDMLKLLVSLYVRNYYSTDLETRGASDVDAVRRFRP